MFSSYNFSSKNFFSLEENNLIREKSLRKQLLSRIYYQVEDIEFLKYMFPTNFSINSDIL